MAIENSQKSAWMIELANYFVREFSFQVITISKKQDEMWLVNVEDIENPILFLTTKDLDFIDHVNIKKHRDSLAMIFNVPSLGYNISVSTMDFETKENHFSVGPHYVSDEKLLNKYPKIDEVLHESNNPERSFTKAVNSLRRSLRKTQKQARRKLLPVTTVISAIIIVMYIISYLLNVKGIELQVVALMLGAYYKRFIVEGWQIWRFLTAGFLHVTPFHLLMNLYALRNLGQILERVLGSKRYLITLLAGIVFGNMFVFILDQGVIGLGLSGGLFALLGVLFVYLYESGAFKNPAVLSRVLSILMINLLISMMPEVSGAAHLGGFQVGIFLGFIFSKRKDWENIRNISKILLAILTVGLIFLMIKNRYVEPHLLLEQEYIKTWYDLGFKKYANYLSRRLK
ncbi:MAG TPA: rhomboid family intramembrane serine protease [Erysipelothrix sp.]